MNSDSNTQHTPGPWEIDGPIIKGPAQAWPETPGVFPRVKSVIVAEVCSGDNGDYYCYPKERAIANRALIAAAPDMLEALEAAIAWADEMPSPYREFPFIKSARAAIAKAKGPTVRA